MRVLIDCQKTFKMLRKWSKNGKLDMEGVQLFLTPCSLKSLRKMEFLRGYLGNVVSGAHLAM